MSYTTRKNVRCRIPKLRMYRTKKLAEHILCLCTLVQAYGFFLEKNSSGHPLSPDIDLYIRAYRGAHTVTTKKIKICVLVMTNFYKISYVETWVWRQY
jgi:hypothetical protein